MTGNNANQVLFTSVVVGLTGGLVVGVFVAAVSSLPPHEAIGLGVGLFGIMGLLAGIFRTRQR